MNLHGIVAGAVGVVNPHVPALLRRSAGYETTPSGRQEPKYERGARVSVQLQSMTGEDLKKTEGMNIQGELRAAYISGKIDSVSRPDQRGGDLLELVDGTQWLVVQILEDWLLTSGWAKVAVRRQVKR